MGCFVNVFVRWNRNNLKRCNVGRFDVSVLVVVASCVSTFVWIVCILNKHLKSIVFEMIAIRFATYIHSFTKERNSHLCGLWLNGDTKNKRKCLALCVVCINLSVSWCRDPNEIDLISTPILTRLTRVCVCVLHSVRSIEANIIHLNVRSSSRYTRKINIQSWMWFYI